MTTTHLEQENIVLVRRGFEAFARVDTAALDELFPAKATWHLQPCGIIAGNYKGKDENFAFFALLGKETDGTFRIVPPAMAAEKNRVLVGCTHGATRHGHSIELRNVLVFAMSDGHVRNVEVTSHIE